MLCRQARTALVERELQLLGPERYAALHRHLARCEACGHEAREGERLLADLALLRGEVPFEIDVRPRVMARVAALGRPALDEISPRQWMLAATAALVAGVMITGGMVSLLPELAGIAERMLGLLTAARGAAASLATSLTTLVAIPLKLLGAFAASLWELAPVLQRLAPAAIALAVLAIGSMSTTIVYFVGRDLRARPVSESR